MGTLFSGKILVNQTGSAPSQTTKPNKRLFRALRGEQLERPPIWLMRQAGRYLPEYRATREQAGSFLDLCYRPELAAEVTHQPLRRFALDAAILFADLPLLAQALGQGLEYREGEGPVLAPPICSGADIDRLSLEGIHHRLGPVYETVRRLADGLDPHVALIGFSGAPWTLATYMAGGQLAARRLGLFEDRMFGRLIELLVRAVVEYLDAQAEAGAEVVQLFDSWAGILSEGEFDRWCIEPTVAIVKELKHRRPDLPVIGFPRGAGLRYEDYARATGVDVISIDSTVPLAFAATHLQSKLCVQGNLDPELLRAGGEALLRETARILNHLGHGPFIFNLGHGILPDTPPAHVFGLVEQVRGWRA